MIAKQYASCAAHAAKQRLFLPINICQMLHLEFTNHLNKVLTENILK